MELLTALDVLAVCEVDLKRFENVIKIDDIGASIRRNSKAMVSLQ